MRIISYSSNIAARFFFPIYTQHTLSQSIFWCGEFTGYYVRRNEIICLVYITLYIPFLESMLIEFVCTFMERYDREIYVFFYNRYTQRSYTYVDYGGCKFGYYFIFYIGIYRPKSASEKGNITSWYI